MPAVDPTIEIFAVLDDDDGPKIKRVFAWAATEGRDQETSDQLPEAVQSGQFADADIENKIAEMKAARSARDCKTSDRPSCRTCRCGHPDRNHERWRPLAP